MADEKNVQAEEQVQAAEPKTDLTEIQGKIEKLSKELELTRNEVSSRDKKISELLKERETVEQASMSEQEKLQMEIQKIQSNFQAMQEEKKRAENKARAIQEFTEKGIDPKFINLLDLSDNDKMDEQIGTISESLESYTKKGAEQVLEKIGSPSPKGNSASKGKLTLAEYNALSAEEKNNAFLEGRIL